MTNNLINKNVFLRRFKASSGRKVGEINRFIFSWCKAGGDMKDLHAWIKLSEEKNLEKGILYWLYLLNFEAEAFRDGKNNETFIKLLRNVILSGEPIDYFGILCPSYKKGIGATGLAEKPGNTTHRAFANLKVMAENTKVLGINCKTRMFFADISVENTKKLGKKDWEMFENIIEEDGKIAKSCGIKYMKLTDFAPELRDEVGADGKIVDTESLPINPKALERAMWRDRQFYPANFGWTIKEAEARTLVHAHSYYMQGEAIRKRLKNPVMVYSAYDYEKGGLYNGKDGSWPPAIIYPKKDATNPPTNTLPKMKGMDDFWEIAKGDLLRH